jgi:hypothetical protein
VKKNVLISHSSNIANFVHSRTNSKALTMPMVFASHSIAAATARMFCGTIGNLISSSNRVAYWFGCKPSGVSSTESVCTGGIISTGCWSAEIDIAFRSFLTAMFPDKPKRKQLKDSMIRDIASAFAANPAWSKRTAPINLPPVITDELEKARLTLWWDRHQRRFLPAIYCPDLDTALFVRGLLGDVCACLGCDRIFVPDRPNRFYCDDPHCGERHRQRRKRDRDRAKQEK